MRNVLQYVILLVVLSPATGVYAQAPVISYGNPPKVFLQNMAISPLTPANSGGSVPATIYGTTTTLAGSGSPDSADGTGAAAGFNAPAGIAVDASGNIYVADFLNYRIRKVTSAGVVTTLTGSDSTFNDGTLAAARFGRVYGIAVDASGNIFVADRSNNRIRKIAGGIVTTFAGSGAATSVDGTGAAASFNGPLGVVTDKKGNVYVSELGNKIRKIDSLGVVTTLAGSGAAGFADGTGTAAKFNIPIGLAMDTSGNIYVADRTNCIVRKVVVATGVVTTYAGTRSAGSIDAIDSVASFNNPVGAAVDSVGNLYIGDYINQKVRRVSPAKQVTTVSGCGCPGSKDGPPDSTQYNNPFGVAVHGGYMYVSDFNGNKIRKIAGTGYTITPALPAGLTFDSTSGTISGTPTAISAAQDYVITAFNASGSSSDTVNIRIAGAPAPSISTATPQVLQMVQTISPVTTVNGGGAVPAVTYGQTTTFAGSGTSGSADGTGTSALFSKPSGTITDAAGNVFVADRVSNKIRKITPAGVVTTFAGSGTAGNADGTGTGAQFNNPVGLAIDASGTLYVADMKNFRIRMITTAGVVTTLAGSDSGFTNGTGAAAQFSYLNGVAVDAAGNVYAADRYNHRIRKVTQAGVVTTFAGSGTPGSTDATGGSASFNNPTGICIDTAGMFYIADFQNNKIRKITPAAVVTTFAGSGTAGSGDGTGTAASFDNPFGVGIDIGGYLYVSDYTNNKIRKITPAAVVSTLAGSGSSGSTNGTGAAASFHSPSGLSVDLNGNVYVSDLENNKIRKITAAGYTINPALPAGLIFDSTSGTISGTPIAVSAAQNYTITAFNAAGSDADTVNIKVLGALPPSIAYLNPLDFKKGAAITTLTPVNGGGPVPAVTYGQTTTFAGSGTSGSTDGTGTAALFSKPSGTITDAAGNVFVADRVSNKIRKITPAGVVTTFAGSGAPGNADGTGTGAQFNNPVGLAIDGTGTLYVADMKNFRIRMITTAGIVTTLAGSDSGFNNGTGAAAKFSYLNGVALDAAGNIYVADRYNQRIRKVTQAGVVTTFAGSGAAGSTDATGGSASFNSPTGICIDTAGMFYIADFQNNKIRKITPAAVVTTFAGSGSAGSSDGTGTAASFDNPFGVGIDIGGYLYVSDYTNNKIRKITPAAAVTTLAGSGSAGSTDGTGAAASFHSPSGLSVDLNGNVYVSDLENNKIRKITAAGYTISRALPTGLTFYPSGAIAGTPTVLSDTTVYKITAYNSAGCDSFNLTIVVDNTGSMRVQQPVTGSVTDTMASLPGKNWLIAPNPVLNKKFRVMLPNTKAASMLVSVYAMDGRKIYSKLVKVDGNALNIELPSMLPGGIYIVSIRGMDAKKILIP